MSQQTGQVTDPRIGMVLQERYRIDRKLGDGGMGAVYGGEHIVIKRRVAIKVLHPQFAQNPEIVARFRREAEAATSIGHPNIVEVTDMGSFPDGSAYMVLEFLDGRDWSDDIEKQGPQPLGKVAHILSQTCDALEAAHAKGIVHRDLKPENIFLIARSGDANFVKVVDFGISKIIDAADGDRKLTQTGTALGTPYYMAPEQCQGKATIDHRADIYSLGVILFQALTGQYPFDDESYPMLVLKICTEQPPMISAYRPDLPPEMQDILHRMLAKHPDHRYSSVAELRAALAPYLGRNEAPVVATNAPSTAQRGPSVLGGGPVSTPSGTAYLPTSSPGVTPYPQTVPPSDNRALIMTVVVMLGLIVVVGGGLGAFFAIRGANADSPVVQETPAEDPVAANPPAVEPPAVDPPTDVQPGREVNVTIRAPEGVTIEINEHTIANPFAGGVPVGEQRVVARGEGYEDYDQMHDFQFTENWTIPMVRSEPEAAPEPTAAAVRPRPRTPTPEVRTLPPGRGTTTARPPTPPSETIGSGSVFRKK